MLQLEEMRPQLAKASNTTQIQLRIEGMIANLQHSLFGPDITAMTEIQYELGRAVSSRSHMA